MAIKKLPSTGDRPGKTPTANGLPAGIHPGGAADSAGFPWAGRTFDHHETAFSDDDGKSPQAYLDAVATVRAAAAVYVEANKSRDPQKISESIAALAAAQSDALQKMRNVRVLLPLVAEAGELGYTPEGKLVEKTQELSIVTVKAPDGRKVMPVFSSVSAMQNWDATARPIPVALPQVVLAAATEETQLVIVDPGTAESELGIRGNQFPVIATDKEFNPCWADQDTQQYLSGLLSQLPEVQLTALLPADPEMRLLTPETELVLGLISGLGSKQMEAVLQQAITLWQGDELLAGAADSLKLRPVAL